MNIAVNQQYARKKSPQRQKTKRPAPFEMGTMDDSTRPILNLEGPWLCAGLGKVLVKNDHDRFRISLVSPHGSSKSTGSTGRGLGRALEPTTATSIDRAGDRHRSESQTMGDSVKDKEQMNERDKGPCVKTRVTHHPGTSYRHRPSHRMDRE